MSTIYFNTTLWYKSYLLEFREGETVQDAFTFSIPAQNEEFTFPQRINETKTFGGSVIDDYGNDMVRISLSGTTVNESTRFIYKGSKGFSYKTGTGEIFYLRDLLKTYGKQANLKNKSVYLYALTGGLKVQSINPKWWKVYPQELQIKRSKENPLSYNYTLTLLGEPEGEETTSWLSATVTAISEVTKYFELAIQCTETVIDLMDKACSTIDTITKITDKINSYEDTIDFYFNDYIDFRNGDYSSGTSTTEDTVSLGDTTVSTGMRYNYTLTDTLYAAIKNIISACKSLHEALQDTDNITFPQDVLELFQCDSDDILDVLNAESMTLESAWLEFFADFVKLTYINDVTVKPGAIDEDDELVQVYGFKTYTAKSTDTWDSLALQYYNDASMSEMLQTYNKSSDTIEAGDKILIPIVSQTSETASDNEVYNSPDTKDNYGKDIELDENGNITIHLNDLSSNEGINNLTQAICNRLSTAVTSRVRLEVYGIRNTVGQANSAAQSFIVASIQQTILADPRVKEVSDISYNGTGDNLTVSVEYTDINDQSQSFGGTV